MTVIAQMFVAAPPMTFTPAPTSNNKLTGMSGPDTAKPIDRGALTLSATNERQTNCLIQKYCSLMTIPQAFLH